MARQLRSPRVVRCVSLSYELDMLCRDHLISPTEAMRVGVSLLLAEKGIKEYDNNLNVIRRIELLQQKLTETSEKLEELKKQ